MLTVIAIDVARLMICKLYGKRLVKMNDMTNKIPINKLNEYIGQYIVAFCPVVLLTHTPLYFTAIIKNIEPIKENTNK